MGTKANHPIPSPLDDRATALTQLVGCLGHDKFTATMYPHSAEALRSEINKAAFWFRDFDYAAPTALHSKIVDRPQQQDKLARYCLERLLSTIELTARARPA